MSIIDAHAHCGIQDTSFDQSFEDYLFHVQGSEIEAVVMFAPVMEIYDRRNPDFADTAEWQARRKRANEHLLTLGTETLEVIPYFFIWNDFAVEQLTQDHRGIKWHRHASEPVYHYDDPRCRQALEEIRKRKMPVVLEEELHHTIRFIQELAAGIRVIVPHLGALNGGYGSIAKAGLWGLPNVYADTALASKYDIMDYIENFGHERLLFGSDFPFGNPVAELHTVERLPISVTMKEAILGLNVKRLLSDSNRNPSSLSP
jgi:predicted TIM-barrel fold metal-dependent hydrolase